MGSYRARGSAGEQRTAGRVHRMKAEYCNPASFVNRKRSKQMSRVEIRKTGEDSMMTSLENLFGRIKDRAYALFEKRGQADGRDIEDWLAAERELLWSPPAELTETGDEFHIRVAIPGFEATEIEVTATPQAVLVKAEASREERKQNEDTLFTEFGERTLFRRVDLPSPADLDRSSATLSHGVLTITAKKAGRPEDKTIAVAA
jgi:HSP20 family molecular chaperone IbpA